MWAAEDRLNCCIHRVGEKYRMTQVVGNEEDELEKRRNVSSPFPASAALRHDCYEASAAIKTIYFDLMASRRIASLPLQTLIRVCIPRSSSNRPSIHRLAKAFDVELEDDTSVNLLRDDGGGRMSRSSSSQIGRTKRLGCRHFATPLVFFRSGNLLQVVKRHINRPALAGYGENKALSLDCWWLHSPSPPSQSGAVKVDI